ncbi:type IV secretory system conjugative DNA transfer family protein [Rudaeicoccus suwonensis]|uniref:Type IV secretory system conjugative DNA transfer VirD4/TraG family protein n=1 Tax=Rudaeicoccus suwonensis TaxID=657409 RepID=A0A561EBV5_9MICO|nr:TraM recognition domain-containing protein [Rudaeicoccus suwonensis]TWE13086.1 type IV secretory system conjugative DNA transfer VirD4/TraG family protein [Rudaeicoccus suwonensis]
MTGQTPRSGNDTAVNLGLGAVAAIGVLAGLLRIAGAIAAWVGDTKQPAGNIGAGLGVLTHPTQPSVALRAPGLSPFAYWAVVAVLLIAAGAGAWLVLRLVRSQTSSDDRRRRAGIATPAQIRKVASGRALRRRGGTLRPSLNHPAPCEVGYLLGRARGQQVWASVEDSMLLIGPPRSGKGLHVVINAILDAPGAVVTTSTRPDNLTVTLAARQKVGPVAVFDPQHLAPGLPAGLRWSPVRGCEDPLTAMIRATGLAAGTGLGGGGVEGGGFWEGKTAAAIQTLLHAAALDGRDARRLYQWALNPTAATDAVQVLQSDPRAAEGWADSLESMIDSDPRTRDSIWQGVGLAFNALADPRVLDAVSPRDGEGFNPDAFLAEHGTLYLLATGAGAGASAALVSAFIEDLTETARRHAARSAGARLDPPLLLALDEIGNLAPLPSLPTLMSDGGGTGITTLTVLQSLAQARQKWGEHHAAAIWDAAIVKIILGGESQSRDLQDLSTLIGERDETTDSTTTDATGGRSHQRSIRRVPILPPDALRTMPFGLGTILLRAAPPIVTDLRPWTSRADADQLTADRREIEQTLRSAA